MLVYVRDRLRASEGEHFRIPTTSADVVLDALNSIERSPSDPTLFRPERARMTTGSRFRGGGHGPAPRQIPLVASGENSLVPESSEVKSPVAAGPRVREQLRACFTVNEFLDIGSCLPTGVAGLRRPGPVPAFRPPYRWTGSELVSKPSRERGELGKSKQSSDIR